MSSAWQPVCDIQHLRRRAQMLADIRVFFAERAVLEVETPLLCHASGTDPHLDFFTTNFRAGAQQQVLFLQTSPEFAMKRLLAAGAGSIYQIGKAFRNGEAGRQHNPEFTMLEWYRVGFDCHQLMDEVAALLQRLLFASNWQVSKLSYQAVFIKHTSLDPLSFERSLYRKQAETLGFPEADALCGNDHLLWLDFLFSHCVQTALQGEVIWLIYDYPAIQSSLARIHPEDPRVAERFEVLIKGMELGNGFHELADAIEQEARFDAEILQRTQQQLPAVVKDERLLAALQAGFPDCSGIALGLDRILMLATNASSIAEVIAFPWENA